MRFVILPWPAPKTTRPGRQRWLLRSGACENIAGMAITFVGHFTRRGFAMIGRALLHLVAFYFSAVCMPGYLLAQPRSPIAEGGNDKGFDMAPETRREVVESAVATIAPKMPAGPVQPTWESLKANYKVPPWFSDAKFGLFMHWGLYAVPAYHNEWYEKHMYATFRQWHCEHFGPQGQFGYKDFIPRFTAEKFDPNAWADLFKRAGVRYVLPTAQHHDNFALWDSAVTPFNAKAMGPKRDLIGELCKAVRARGMKFGVSNHGIENFQFINPQPELMAELKARQADLFDPKWADFYNVADRSDAACQRFLINWAQRNVELIDKYQPDLLWFDNGIDARFLDPLKLWIAAYYYNRAAEWGRAVSLSTKKAAFAPSDRNTETIGSIIDFEKVGARSPAGVRTGSWQVDDPIASNSWGYINDLKLMPVESIIGKLVDTVSKNGNFVLNISPRADGTIPQDQQDELLEIGHWLEVNGDAIYGTHAWTMFGEGSGSSGDHGDRGRLNVRFTVKGDTLYAIILGDWPGETVTIASLAEGNVDGKIESVTMMGSDSGELKFSRDANGLNLSLPPAAPCKYGYALRIIGVKTNPPPTTISGNPQ
jgi:alpha-L-fucosidase